MLKIKHSLLNCFGAGITLALIGATPAPASAQSVIVIDGASGIRRQPAVGSFIYGSPIPTPMPVDPTTGLMPSPSDRHYYSYPSVNDRHYYSYPSIRQNEINNSTLVNPVVVNRSWHRRPFRGESRVILQDSWHRTPVRQRSRVILTYP
ncbi:hypothetical protein [Dendronalium sp. ChiSLP03b]|uniref:hypothetical protein n=1 Tax=Dendronalium sp. ChiSLP03b TaxID=3075381 RepID=UPI002AD545CE|nr:hypothetical protein [Dendronalium sp. ChiSLP03b]MDZ8206315.1 hypothetical protein [Dendronalium sp. ChiSLP03b]